MALNWAALADEIDREKTRGIQASLSQAHKLSRDESAVALI